MAACAQGKKVRFWRVTELITTLREAEQDRQLLRLRQQLAKLDLKSSEPSKDALDKIAIVTWRVCPLEAKPQPKEDEKPIKKAARTKEEDEKETAKPVKPKVPTENESEKRPRTAENDNRKSWGTWKTLSNDQLRERCATSNPIVRMNNACAKRGY